MNICIRLLNLVFLTGWLIFSFFSTAPVYANEKNKCSSGHGVDDRYLWCGSLPSFKHNYNHTLEQGKIADIESNQQPESQGGFRFSGVGVPFNLDR